MSAIFRSDRHSNVSSVTKPLFESLEQRQLLSAVPLEPKIKVAMVTDAQGSAVNESRVTVRFSENITLADPTLFRMFGYSINPTSGSGLAQQKTTINIKSVEPGPDGNKLIFVTDRRVRKGARLIMYNGAVTNASDGTNIGEQQVLLPKGLNKERFTLACRAFKPTQLKFFDPADYDGAGALVATPNAPSTSSVTNALTAYLDKAVAAGFLTTAQKTQALGIYNNANIQQIFPSANLRAALAALVGTVAEPAIDQYTTNANVTGKPFTVVDFSTEVSGSAVIAETKGNPSTGRLRTLFKTSYRGESFLALAPILAHEMVHQDVVGAGPDLPDGINEEQFAVTVETMVWAQLLLNEPAPADDHTALTTHHNANLLAILNSGDALFPRVGVYDGPILGTLGALPGSKTPTDGQGVYTSFENFIRRHYAARGFNDVDTGGNAYARTVQNNITGRTDTAAFQFSDSRIAFYDDSQQIISDRNAVRLAAILKLQITTKVV